MIKRRIVLLCALSFFVLLRVLNTAVEAPHKKRVYVSDCDGFCTDVCRDFNRTIVQRVDISNATHEYIRKHVAFGIVTGSFEKFFRLDTALCSWVSLLPPKNVVIISDNVSLATNVVDTPANHRLQYKWVEGTVPRNVKFSKKHLAGKGYTIGWFRAQFRFIRGLEALARLGRVVGYENLTFTDVWSEHLPELKWFIVLDDDTFVHLSALVDMLSQFDKSPEVPTYIGEGGWGGAGHFLNLRALQRFLGPGYEPCVHQNMVSKLYASDVALKKCLPGLGVRMVNDDRLSHCQATFLRERMLTGRHVSSHVKREFDRHPRFLALWRIRLYYQTMYHGNRDAYESLMQVGACAYGSCKIGKCREDHDRAALAIFERLSSNNSRLPI